MPRRAAAATSSTPPLKQWNTPTAPSAPAGDRACQASSSATTSAWASRSWITTGRRWAVARSSMSRSERCCTSNGVSWYPGRK